MENARKQAEIAKYKEEHQSKTSAAQIDLSGKRVLVVEDNELNREIAVDLLEESGLLVDKPIDAKKLWSTLNEVIKKRYGEQ